MRSKAVGQPCEPVGNRLDGDIGVRAHQADGRSVAVTHDRNAARGPAIPTVLVSQRRCRNSSWSPSSARAPSIWRSTSGSSSGWTRFSHASGVFPTSCSSQPASEIHRGEK